MDVACGLCDCYCREHKRLKQIRNTPQQVLRGASGDIIAEFAPFRRFFIAKVAQMAQLQPAHDFP